MPDIVFLICEWFISTADDVIVLASLNRNLFKYFGGSFKHHGNKLVMYPRVTRFLPLDVCIGAARCGFARRTMRTMMNVRRKQKQCIEEDTNEWENILCTLSQKCGYTYRM